MSTEEVGQRDLVRVQVCIERFSNNIFGKEMLS